MPSGYNPAMPVQDPQQLTMQAVVLHRAGKFQEAERIYRQVLAIDPRNADAYHFLGVMATQLEKYDISIDYIRRALSINPNFPQARYNLGLAYLGKEDPDAALRCFYDALAMRPDYPEAMFNFGYMLMNHVRDRLDEATAIFEKLISRIDRLPAQRPAPLPFDISDALEIDLPAVLNCKPDFARVYSALGITYKARGEPEKSLPLFRRAMELEPRIASVHSHLLFTMLFDPTCDAASIAREHAEWNRRHAAPLAAHIQPHTNDRSPERPLRIGYVSPDFTVHPVGRFMLPLLENHDRAQFKIFCYSNVMEPDFMTDKIAALAAASGAYRRTNRMRHSRLAKLIRDDQIDILVDLTMHTDKNRLLVFARKPAPVQLTYLAYAGTTGLPAIDYRFSDAYLDPPGIDESVYAEKTLRLSTTYWCYQPMPDTPEVNALPALSAGHVTFGSLNSFSKVTEEVLQLWPRILAAVPNSRLLMICPVGRHRERVLAHFAAAGVSADRIEFHTAIARAKYFEFYHRVDIALDPFPYGGGTTTCDSLYMAVPVVTLRGSNAMTRAGASILSTLGLPELIASTPAEYQQIAATLAADLPRLADLRAGLRERMKKSPLMDAPAFARDIESQYRTIWRTWCGIQAK